MTILNNGNVGIGATSPSSLLSVGSTSQFQVNSSGAIAAATGLTSSGTITLSSIANDGAEATGLFINGSNQVVSRELGSNAFTSTAYANTSLSNLSSVAINTSLLSNAANTLDLGSSTLEWNSLFLADGSGLTAGGGLFFGSNQDFLLTYDSATSGALELSDGTNTFLSVTDSGTAGTFAFNTDDLYIKSDGKVGIGTTDPVAALTIGSGVDASLANGAGDLYVENDLEVDGKVAISPGLSSSTNNNLS